MRAIVHASAERLRHSRVPPSAMAITITVSGILGDAGHRIANTAPPAKAAEIQSVGSFICFA
jgi:hypothetical protein